MPGKERHSASFESPDYGPAASFVRAFVRFLSSVPPAPGIALNVNLPDIAIEDYRGIRWTRQRGYLFCDAYAERQGADGRTEYVLDGDEKDIEALEPGSDARAVREGFVSVTPLRFDLTCDDGLRDLRDALPSLKDLLGPFR